MQMMPHLNFPGHGGEAAELYQDAFGLKPVTKNREADEKVMRLTGGDISMKLSDEPAPPEECVSLAVTFHYSDDAQHAYDTLTQQGGRVRTALGETSEKRLYGSVTDKFGVTWHIILE